MLLRRRREILRFKITKYYKLLDFFTCHLPLYLKQAIINIF